MPIDVSGIIARRARLNITGGSHPNLPGKPFPGTARGDIPPIVDPSEDPNAQTDLTRRSVINRATKPVPIELRGTVAGRRTPVALLLGKFRTPGKPLYWKHQPNIGWIWTLGFGEKINQPTKANVNGKDYTFTSQGDGRWHADIDGGDLYVYDGTQDYVDTNLQYISSINYTDTHETHCYGVLVLTNPVDWPSVTLVGEGMPDVWDPRLNSGSGGRAYTTNPALLTAYLIETYTPLAIDWTTVETAADYCDETINGIKRSEIGLALQRREKIEDWIAVLREYAYCYVINNGASVRFITDKARDSVETLGNNEIDIGSTNWVRGDLNTTPENVVVEWTDSDTGVRDESYALDGAYDLEDFYNMKGFLHEQQAQLWATRRYNKMTLRDLSGTLEVNGVGIKLDFGDVVTVSDSRFSAIQSKDFEILEITSRDSGKYRCKVIEYQPNTYTDAPQSQPQTPDTTLPDPFDIDSVAVTVSATSTYNTETQTVVMDVSWDNPDFAYVDGYNVVVTDTDASPDRVDGTMTVSPRGKVTATFSGLQGGTEYSIKVTPFNLFSDGFESSTTHTTADDTVAPGAPANVIIERFVDFGDIYMHFNPPNGELDIDYYQAEDEYRTIAGPGSWNTGGGNFTGAVGNRPTSSPAIFEPVALSDVNSNEARFRVRAVDRSGNIGAWSDWSPIYTLQDKTI